MILLTDNDILVKLAQCDLVEEALSVFQCGLSECYVLDSAKHSLYLNDVEKCVSRRVGCYQTYDRLCSLVQSCRELGAADDDLDFMDELLQIDSIDAGELLLLMHAFSLYQNRQPYLFTTGDKRALVGISMSESARAKQILFQRVECVESIILKAIQIYGFSHISTKVVHAQAIVAAEKYDKVLRMAFGAGRDEDHSNACLSQYLAPVGQFIRP
ncbi:hypothetical protein [Pseudomonas sp. GW101-3H06]|jgi:hypothetical protein|uniref:hypothetical protein n=1 Tax=Pseudomonas sp. GW101-3H06 TaxID=2751347 RepID=UPI001A919FE6|nr:hypothetical protein [Pseudomonas sp. GW101-3H06]